MPKNKYVRWLMIAAIAYVLFAYRVQIFQPFINTVRGTIKPTT